MAGRIAAAAAARALVLLLDDLHWADPDTLELLDVVTRRLQAVSLVVIATYRAEDVHRGHLLSGILPRLHRDRPVAHLRPAGLSVADMAALVQGRYGPCSPELAVYLHERSEGNPFFAGDVLRDLAERRLLRLDEQVQVVVGVGVDVRNAPVVAQHLDRCA